MLSGWVDNLTLKHSCREVLAKQQIHYKDQLTNRTFSLSSSSSAPLLHLCSPVLLPVQSFPPGRRSAIIAAVHLLLPSSPRIPLAMPAAVAPPRCPAPRAPRFPKTPVGRHLTAAMESPQASLGLLSLTRTNTA
jgi:hypothetical protein